MATYEITAEMNLNNIIAESREVAQALNEFADNLEQIEKKYDAEPQENHTCHTCRHYISGEYDGSCGSYICKNYSNWESEDLGDYPDTIPNQFDNLTGSMNL